MNTSKSKSKIQGGGIFPVVLGTLSVMTLVVAFAFAVRGTNFFLYRIFVSREEAVRRQAFEESEAYNEGMQQELQSMAFQYAQADDSHKQALGSVILHRAAAYDVRKLSPDLRSLVERLRANRVEGGK